jgi:hypothetical protein
VNWISALPTTNLRIFVTICLSATVVLTEVVIFVATKEWKPLPLELLSYLIFSAGLDVAQFHSKRVTTFAPTGAKATEDSST